MADLRKLIKCVLLIWIKFHHMFWVLWVKGKTWEKTHFDIFGSPIVTLQLPVWLSTKIFKSHYLGLFSSDFETEDSSEISWSREFMVRNIFWYCECCTYGNPCDSSPPSRAKIRPVTSVKFSKHGFSFFHLNLPFSFESWSKWHFGC